ncbi:MAG TPA: F0F1 ATP synthase subunit delta [Accumulibacter sp.]|nr:F0F1 ATP synthase subunit delta [Accumulibacter sp.]HMW16779.1 F0F1 ATP synthase subunit delta [Accumulibacter sp.]HMX23008.1 F0F1 ATP synthase subunit delta [Accumulibacter sp.]HNC17888.1 F0F1 ATP synthase subunit delta [Accumulibacter sp.]HND80703.1 F0F1 ATP synthase subunit delta [Accumulibacter sp.]
MAELVTIARPYAEAVFRIALENKALAAWSERLSLLSSVATDPQMRLCIGNPELSASQKSDLFKSVVGKALDGGGTNLIDVLAASERLSFLPEIASLFEAQRAAQEGVKEATIYSAFPLDDVQRKALVADLETRFKTRLTAEVVVDQSLIGGVKIVIGDQVLDTSVSGKLESLRLALKN